MRRYREGCFSLDLLPKSVFPSGCLPQDFCLLHFFLSFFFFLHFFLKAPMQRISTFVALLLRFPGLLTLHSAAHSTFCSTLSFFNTCFFYSAHCLPVFPLRPMSFSLTFLTDISP